MSVMSWLRSPVLRNLPGRRVLTWTIAAVAGAIALFKYLAVFSATYIDDTFITLQYADTLLGSHCWGFFPGRPTNTATSPLNVAITALGGALTGSVLDAVTWITTGEFGAMFIVLYFISKKLFGGFLFGGLAFLAFVTNPLLLSTLGLETVLFMLMFLVSLLFFLHHRWFVLALALGLLTLTRAEGVLLFLICLVAMPVSVAVRTRFALLYGLVLLPWHLFSWIYLGSLVPDTLLIKKGQEAWAGVSFPTGLMAYYLRRFPISTASSFVMLPFAALAWGRATPLVRTVAALVVSYGVLQYVGYSALRVPPYHWYYAPLVLASVVLGALGAACALGSGAVRPAFGKVVASLSLVVPVAGLVGLGLENGFPPREAAIHSNWATHDEYRAMGLWLRDHVDPRSTVMIRGEIGTLAFYSKRLLVNYFSDRNEVAPPWYLTTGRVSRVPVVGPLITGAMRLNFLWRQEQARLPPPTYTLILTPGRHTRPEGPDVVMTWYTSSRWMPSGMTAVLRRTELSYLQGAPAAPGPRSEANRW